MEHMEKHKSMLSMAMEDSTVCVVETIKEITKDREELSAAELDDLKDCWHILKSMCKVEMHMAGKQPL